MEYQASKSDIDFEFESSDDDISIATNASSVDQAVGLNEDDERDLELRMGVGGSDSDGDSDASIQSDYDEDDHDLILPTDMGDQKVRLRTSSVDSEDDFGAPIVVPLKTGSEHSGPEGPEPIDAGSRSSRGSRRNDRSRSFNRRLPARTKSGEGMTASGHSAASGNRRPPGRTKSGEGIPPDNDAEKPTNLRRRQVRRAKSGDLEGFRRRPPQRTKSGEGLRSNHSTEEDGGNDENGDEALVDYNVALDDDDDNFDTNADQSQKNHKYREEALRGNMARRQRSNDTLGAMREATRSAPSRSQSGVDGISNVRRREPERSQSSGVATIEGLATPGRRPLRRRAPPRSKSGALSLPEPPLES